MYAFDVINFLLSPTFFCIPQILISCFSFSFSSKYFNFSLKISSLAHMLLRSLLFNVYMFLDFSLIFLPLISSLIPLWSRNRHCVISIPLNLLGLPWWLRQWRIRLQCRRPGMISGLGRPPGGGFAIHSIFLPGEFLWTEESGKLQR